VKFQLLSILRLKRTRLVAR